MKAKDIKVGMEVYSKTDLSEIWTVVSEPQDGRVKCSCGNYLDDVQITDLSPRDQQQEKTFAEEYQAKLDEAASLYSEAHDRIEEVKSSKWFSLLLDLRLINTDKLEEAGWESSSLYC